MSGLKEELRLLFKSFREFHFTVANEVCSFRQFVTKPDDQEQRNTNVGCRDGAPVDSIREERFIVLAQRNNQTQNEGENWPQRKNPERYGRSFRS